MVPSKTPRKVGVFLENINYSWEAFNFSSPDASRSSQMLSDAPGASQIPPGVSLPDTSRIPPRYLLGPSRCLQMSPDDFRWLQMPPRCLLDASQDTLDASKSLQMPPRDLLHDTSSIMPPPWCLLPDAFSMMPPPWCLLQMPRPWCVLPDASFRCLLYDAFQCFS